MFVGMVGISDFKFFVRHSCQIIRDDLYYLNIGAQNSIFISPSNIYPKELNLMQYANVTNVCIISIDYWL